MSKSKKKESWFPIKKWLMSHEMNMVNPIWMLYNIYIYKNIMLHLINICNGVLVESLFLRKTSGWIEVLWPWRHYCRKQWLFLLSMKLFFWSALWPLQDFGRRRVLPGKHGTSCITEYCKHCTMRTNIVGPWGFPSGNTGWIGGFGTCFTKTQLWCNNQ